MSETKLQNETTIVPVRFGAIFLGVFIVIGIQMILALLGSAAGLSLPLESLSVPSKAVLIPIILATVVSVSASFFIGGYIASRASHQKFKFDALIHGLATWGVAMIVVALIMTRMTSSMGGLFAKAGLGVTSAVTIGSVLKEIQDLKPRIVTDIQFIKGKTVTTFETNTPQTSIAEKVSGQVKQDVKEITSNPEVKSDLRNAAKDIRVLLAIANWTMFLALGLGGVAAAWGGLLAARIPLRSVKILRQGKKSDHAA